MSNSSSCSSSNDVASSSNTISSPSLSRKLNSLRMSTGEETHWAPVRREKLGNEISNERSELVQQTFEHFMKQVELWKPSTVQDDDPKFDPLMPWITLCQDFIVLKNALSTSDGGAPLPWQTLGSAMVLCRRFVRSLVFSAPTNSPGRSERVMGYLDAKQLYMKRDQSKLIGYAAFLLSGKTEETIFSLARLERAISHTMPSNSPNTLSDQLFSSSADPFAFNTQRPASSNATQTVNHSLIQDIREYEVELLAALGFDVAIQHAHHTLLRIATALHICSAQLDVALNILHCSFMCSACLLDQLLVSVAALYLSFFATPLENGGNPEKSLAWCEKFGIETGHILFVIQYQFLPVLNVLYPKEAQRIITNTFFGNLNASATSPSILPIRACRRLTDFYLASVINEGNYGTVYKAQDNTKNGQVVALKLLKRTKSKNGFPYYMLREILYLIRLNHEGIIKGYEMVMNDPASLSLSYSNCEFYIVMEYVKCDMLKLLRHQISTHQRFNVAQAKHLMVQLLNALSHMHDLDLLHRDIKLANLLLTEKGVLKVADLGSIRDATRTTLKLTVHVVTLWYRPPELLFGARNYSSAIDIWSIGCLFVELLTYSPLFPGKSEKDMLARILKIKGSPDPDTWKKQFDHLPLAHYIRPHLDAYAKVNRLKERVPSLSDLGLDLLNKMLMWDHQKRISAKEALAHPYLTSESPLPQQPIPPTALYHDEQEKNSTK